MRQAVPAELIEQSLERRHFVTAFVRSPQKLGRARKGLTVIEGDLLDAAAVGAALASHDAVLSAIGPPRPGRTTIKRDSAQTLVTAMDATGVRRLLILGVGVLFDDIGTLACVLRNTILRHTANDSAEMERIVKASHLDWTIVRPPRLTNGSLTTRYRVNDDHLPVGATAKVSRSDLAHFMLEEVEHPAHLRRIVGIAYTGRVT